MRLGTVLGPSWSHLGVSFGHFLLENVMFRENRRFSKDMVSRPALERLGVDLGRFLLENVMFRENLRFSKDVVPRRVLG